MTMATTKQAEQQSTRPAPSRIPEFRTIEEAAEFWDTHDSTEFEDEFETVHDVRFVPAGPKTPYTVELDDKTIARLEQRAEEEGVPAAVLAGVWIREHVYGGY